MNLSIEIPVMKDNFFKLIEQRRSVYALGKDEVLPRHDLTALVKGIVKFMPSAFNSQSARVVVLYAKNHEKLWTIVEEVLKQVVPAASFEKTAQKIASFRAGFGTILFFEEQNTVEALQKDFPLYADAFPVWSEQSGGMLQFAVWTALAENGIGASLQHYNPLIDDAVREEWNLPKSWKLLAEMPFGSIKEPAGEKTFLPIEERVKIFA